MLLVATLGLALTLDEAWSAAQANNHDLKLVHEQTVQAQALRFKAYAAIQPQISFTANYIFNDHATTVDLASSFFSSMPEEFAPFFEDTEIPPTVIEQQRYLTWEFQAAQPLFSGQALPGLRLVGQSLKATIEEEQAIIGKVRAGLTRAYWGVVVAKQGVELAEAALVNVLKHQEMVKVQLSAGVAPPTAELQVELAVSKATREVASAKASKVAAEEALKVLTGLEGSVEVVEPSPLSLPFDSPDAVLAQAQTSRADLSAASYRVAAARANQNLSYAGWLPVVYGVFKFSHSPATDFNPEPNRWRLILNMEWKLWDGGMRVGDNQAAASQLRQATEAELKMQAELEQQVLVAWEQYARSKAALSAVEREVVLSAENLRLAEAAFNAGSLTFLDLEDARLGWQASQVSRLVEKMNRELAIAELLVAGGVW
jgi:outer membrane protein